MVFVYAVVRCIVCCWGAFVLRCFKLSLPVLSYHIAIFRVRALGIVLCCVVPCCAVSCSGMLFCLVLRGVVLCRLALHSGALCVVLG